MKKSLIALALLASTIVAPTAYAQETAAPAMDYTKMMESMMAGMSTGNVAAGSNTAANPMAGMMNPMSGMGGMGNMMPIMMAPMSMMGGMGGVGMGNMMNPMSMMPMMMAPMSMMGGMGNMMQMPMGMIQAPMGMMSMSTEGGEATGAEMMMNPANWMNPATYSYMMSPEAMMNRMNPSSWLRMMNPSVYTHMMNPSSYMQAGTQAMNPETYTKMAEGIMKPEAYTDWYDTTISKLKTAAEESGAAADATESSEEAAQ